MRLGIFGTGYVGLITSVCFAELGHDVVAVDTDREVVARLSDGASTIYEPDLEVLLRGNLRRGRLAFTTSPEAALAAPDMVFLCVGTPAGAGGRADLSQVEQAVRGIAPLLSRYTLIVEKSTVPVNTACRIGRAMRQAAAADDLYEVASNPEFLREGCAVRDFLQPDRIVLGADSERARGLLLDLYRPHFRCPLLVTSVKMAELIKHAANAFLATKISFINMVADLCEKVGGDVDTVARGIGLDHRIGPHFLRAGLGFGGSCFGKDLAAFVRIAEEAGVDFALLREVAHVNARRVDALLGKLEQALWVVRGKTVAVLGVAFKPDTDDIRDAPSLRVIARLLDGGASLRIYDPRAAGRMAAVYPAGPEVAYVASAYEAARGAHALAILTEWDEFRDLDLRRVRALMRTPVVVDGRNLFAPEAMSALGIEYYRLGRADPVPALVRV